MSFVFKDRLDILCEYCSDPSDLVPPPPGLAVRLFQHDILVERRKIRNKKTLSQWISKSGGGSDYGQYGSTDDIQQKSEAQKLEEKKQRKLDEERQRKTVPAGRLLTIAMISCYNEIHRVARIANFRALDDCALIIEQISKGFVGDNEDKKFSDLIKTGNSEEWYLELGRMVDAFPADSLGIFQGFENIKAQFKTQDFSILAFKKYFEGRIDAVFSRENHENIVQVIVWVKQLPVEAREQANADLVQIGRRVLELPALTVNSIPGDDDESDDDSKYFHLCAEAVTSDELEWLREHQVHISDFSPRPHPSIEEPSSLSASTIDLQEGWEVVGAGVTATEIKESLEAERRHFGAKYK